VPIQKQRISLLHVRGMRTCAVRTNMQPGHANFAFIKSVAFNYLRDSASPACVSGASSRPRQSGTRGEKKRGRELEVCAHGYGWLKPMLLGGLSSPASTSRASGLRRRRVRTHGGKSAQSARGGTSTIHPCLARQEGSARGEPSRPGHTHRGSEEADLFQQPGDEQIDNRHERRVPNRMRSRAAEDRERASRRAEGPRVQP